MAAFPWKVVEGMAYLPWEGVESPGEADHFAAIMGRITWLG